MKKFLEDLKKELNKRNISQEDVDEILSDHEEIIESALAKGLSEEQVIDQLGNPADLARELAEFSEKEKTQEVDESSYKLWKEFEITEDNLSIWIQLLSEEVTIKEAQGSQLKVFHMGSKNVDQYEADYDKGIFKLSAQKEFGISFFRKINNNISFIIEVPKSIKIKEFKFKSVSSNLIINGLNAEKSSISLTSGDVSITNGQLGETQWNTVSGDIKILESIIKLARISLVSGDLELKNTTIFDRIELNTVSGDILINEVSSDMCDLHTVSGDVNSTEFYPNSISFKSVSGDMDIKNTKQTDIKIISKKSVSGKLNITTT
jgi:hypothetical protein